MTVSEFLENEIPTFLLGAFFGRIEQTTKGDFFTYSDYRNWQIFSNLELYNKSKFEYIEQLNEICSPFAYWENGKNLNKVAVFMLKNDIQLNRTNFFNRLNKKIYSSSFLYESGLTNEKKMFIRGFVELRCSIDRNRKYITIDCASHSKQETKRLRLFIDYLEVPAAFANFNFRECQPDYYTMRQQRDNQFRINAFWYGQNIGFINNYKTAAFEHCFPNNGKRSKNGVHYFNCNVPIPNESNVFETRLNYYAENIEGRTLTQNDIQQFKAFIGQLETHDNEFIRDPMIVKYIRYFTKDECVCCKQRYAITDRTCLLRGSTDRYYLEIHHVVSVGKNKQLDDIDNLVKICPACHATLKRGRAEEATQKKLIAAILNDKKNVFDFCMSYFDCTDFNSIVQKVWEHLN